MVFECPWVMLLGLSFVLNTVVTAQNPSSGCSSFLFKTNLDSAVSLTRTTSFEAGDLVNITNLWSSINVNDLPAFCRIELAVITNSTAGSTAIAEIWLPEAWNGRFLGFGNSGFAGGVNYADLGHVAITQGFAGLSTDTGHSATTNDATWAGPDNDNAIIDWAWRALHLSVQAGKGVIQEYYGRPISKSYYLGCSTGGRQGLKEVQQFPDDFDGVVVGSPANWMTHLQPWSIHINLNVLPVGSPQWISSDMWSGFIHDEVMRQCDGIDGVTDGMINDPRLCLFRPETLACIPGQNTSTCLNSAQIKAIRAVYSDYYETDGTYMFGSYYPGGEAEYSLALVGPQPVQLGMDYMQYFVANDTAWNYTALNYSLIQLTDEIDPGQANAIETNLTAFAGAEHNGKIIHYVGWADQLISPGNSIHYYESVHAAMQLETGMNIDDYYRLFTVPGMQHCQGGYGANAFGGKGQAAAGMPPASFDPVHNVVSAIVEWVEYGIAPDYFVATYYNNNTYTEGVGFTRPLCKYPGRIQYIGGDVNQSTSFICS